MIDQQRSNVNTTGERSNASEHLRPPSVDKVRLFRSVLSTTRPLAAMDCKSESWLPALCLTSAFGLLLLAFADTGSRGSASWAVPLFWIGLLVLFMPITVRLVGQGAPRQERMELIVVLGLGLYLAKLFHSPIAFTFHDELLHWKTANDILGSGHLFRENSILPVSPLYPGLEIVTSALGSLSGLSIFSTGIVVIGVARLVLMLSLYLLYEQISHSAHVAGVAALLYTTNSHFLFFDAMYAYESLALPLAIFVLFAAAYRERLRDRNRIGLTLAIVVGLGAVVVTHHLTSYLLVTFFALWALVPVLRGYAKEVGLWSAGEETTQRLAQYFTEQLVSLWRYLADYIDHWRNLGPGKIAILGLVASLTWLTYVAPYVIGYLSPLVGSAIGELVNLITSEPTLRLLFRDYGGWVAPVWERVTSITAIGLTLLGLPFGLLGIWWHHRANVIVTALAIGTLAYPISLTMRLSRAGADVSDRSTAFLFVGVALVLAVGVESFWLRDVSGWKWPVVITGLVAVMFVGGIIIGAGPVWARLPGPYLVSADMRSIEPNGVSAAEWARRFLGPNNRIATDRINRLLMASYGEQYPVSNVGDRIDISSLFFSPVFGITDRNLLERGRIRYLVVDHRLSTGLPRIGVYFEDGEPDSFQHTTPIDPAALAKFDRVKDISRLFDSGDIVIYKVGALGGEP